MGLFYKKDEGTIEATDSSGRRFAWKISNFRDTQYGATLDSPKILNYAKAKFNIHLSVGNTGDIGLFVHFKKPGIPKYSIYMENSRGSVLPQETAHTIPEGTDHSGHWNLANMKSLLEFLGGNDTLVVRLTFDQDELSMHNLEDQNRVAILWTIPRFKHQHTHPFTSVGFTIDGSVLVCRVDSTLREGLTERRVGPDDVATYVFSLVSISSRVPAHTIELIDSTGEVYASGVRDASKKGGITLTIAADLLTSKIGADGAVFTNFGLEVLPPPEDGNMARNLSAEKSKQSIASEAPKSTISDSPVVVDKNTAKAETPLKAAAPAAAPAAATTAAVDSGDKSEPQKKAAGKKKGKAKSTVPEEKRPSLVAEEL